MKIWIAKLSEKPQDWPISFMDTRDGSNQYYMMDTPERDVTVEYSPNDFRICFNGDVWCTTQDISQDVDEVATFFDCLDQYMLPGHGTLRNECFICQRIISLYQNICLECDNEDD